MSRKTIKLSFKTYMPFLILLSSLIVFSAGCEKKAEKPEGENAAKDTTNMVASEQSNADTTAKADTTKQYPDLTGTWTGTFESHAATLKVTEQNGADFKANLSVAYRQPMNKKVSGKLDLSTKQVTMADAEKSRTESSYSATLSDDGTKISGTSTMKVGGTKSKFTFTKK